MKRVLLSPKERLRIYKLALKDYEGKWSFRKLFGGKRLQESMYSGFCHYFSFIHDIDLFWLSELVEQKPKKQGFLYGGADYWFDPGKREPRIEALKKAILLCKSPLRQGN